MCSNYVYKCMHTALDRIQWNLTGSVLTNGYSSYVSLALRNRNDHTTFTSKCLREHTDEVE